ncbi:hypothetical protein ATG_09110 [Desulfurococcaceae archaeon AG1]|jgi:xanthosine utilization system XapX-like protein|nr:MAG: hypothetical protein DJ555_03910 [Desulfurococcaceae archaeon]GAY25708.1 hypothetical protein ATG_09110 [Desulfurococcaceae archaeon AG1]
MSLRSERVGFYRLFILRLVAGLGSGLSFSIYKSLYPGPNHLWIALESFVFLLIGLGVFQALYMAIVRPSRKDSIRFILTQIAAHYIGSMILIPG